MTRSPAILAVDSSAASDSNSANSDGGSSSEPPSSALAHTHLHAPSHSSAHAVAAFLTSAVAGQLDPVTRQYLVFAWACEQAAQQGGVELGALHALCAQTATIFKPDLAEALSAAPAHMGTVANLLAQACAALVPAQDFVAQGRLISLEGGDGSGKTTQAQALAAYLAAQGVPVVATRALGGAGSAGAALRALILDPSYQWSALGEALLTASIYRETFVKIMAPALAAGHHVITDRWLDTLLVYLPQAADGLDESILRQIYDIVVSDMAPGLEPELTFILDLPYTAALARRAGRSEGQNRTDRNEGKGDSFHQTVFSRYQALAKTAPRYAMVDALQPPEVLTHILAQQLQPVLIHNKIATLV